jgi:hypothetical protein
MGFCGVPDRDGLLCSQLAKVEQKKNPADFAMTEF